MVSILAVLPYEIIEHTLRLCERVDDVLMFGRTSKTAKAIMLHYLRGILYSRHMPDLSGIKGFKGFFPEQVKGIFSLRENTTQNLFLQSPMGTGKTILSIIHAIESWKRYRIRTIIVVTAKCFTSWMEHFDMMGFKLVKCRPKQSDLLVLHTTCKKHRDFILERGSEEFRDLPYYIILTTKYYVSSKSRGPRGSGTIQEKLRALSGIYQQTIADEAQCLETDHIINFFKHFERNIYLSASPVPSVVKQGVGRGYESLTHKVYDARINLECQVDHPIKMEYQLLAGIGSDLTQIARLLHQPTFKGKKVILFTHWNPRHTSHNVAYLKEAVPHFSFIRFYNTSLASKQKFMKHGEKCVLVTSILSATEGTNFEIADSAIYIDFGSLVIERARQCFGRVRRRNNPNPVVYNYIFYTKGSPLSYIRTKLNLYHAKDMRLNIERKRDTQIVATYKYLLSKGINACTLPIPEFVTIFGLNKKPKEPLPYKETEYTFPLFQLLQYMNIGHP